MPSKKITNTKNTKNTKKGKNNTKNNDISESESEISDSDSEEQDQEQDQEQDKDEDDNDDDLDDDNSVEDDDDEVSNDDSISDKDDNDNDNDNDEVSYGGRETCIYNFTNNENVIKRIEKLTQDEKDILNKNTDKFVPDDERVGRKYMTKYEWVRLISDRTAQIANGSSIMIKTGKDTVDVNTLTPKEIAIIELESGRCPLYLVREMPNGQREKWNPNEMIFTKRYLMK